MPPRDEAEQFVRCLQPKQFERMKSACTGQTRSTQWDHGIGRTLLEGSLLLGTCLGTCVLLALVGALANDFDIDPEWTMYPVVVLVVALATMEHQLRQKRARQHLAAMLRDDHADGLLPQCLSCHYLTRGMKSATCPECGGRVRWSWPTPMPGEPALPREPDVAPRRGGSPAAQARHAARHMTSDQAGWINRYFDTRRRWWVLWIFQIQVALATIMAVGPLLAALGLLNFWSFAVAFEILPSASFGPAMVLFLAWIVGWSLTLCWLVSIRRQVADHLLHHCPDGLLPECLRCGHPTQGLQRDHCPACGERVRWKAD